MALELSGTVMVEGGASRIANLTASTLIKTGAGKLDGIIVNSHTSGTIKFYDGTTNAGSVMHGTISFASGERAVEMYGEIFGTGLYVDIGGTLNCTIRYR